MRATTLARLWLVIGVFELYLMLNAMVGAYKWGLKFPGIAFEFGKPLDAALIGCVAGLGVMMVLLWVGQRYARHFCNEARLHRLPPPFSLNDRNSLVLHLAQLAAFLLLPLIALISLFIKYIDGPFCVRTETETIGCDTNGFEQVGAGADHFSYVPFSQVLPSRSYIYGNGADYWPFWEPWAILLLWVAVFVLLGRFISWFLRPPPTKIIKP